MPRLRTTRARLRSQTGQTAAEYMGMILIIAVIIAALVHAGIGATIAGGIGDALAKVSGNGGGPAGGPSDPSAPGGPNGPGGPNDPSAPGGPNGPGGPNDPNAPADPNAPGAPGDPAALTACMAAASAGYCLKTLDPARYFVETRPNAQLDRVQRLTHELASGRYRTGSPEFIRLDSERQRAVDNYLKAKKTAGNPGLRTANTVKKVIDPRFQDLQGKTPRSPIRTPSGSAAKRVTDFLGKHGGKIAKGAGVLGTALGAYNNVKKDGVGKGAAETAGSVAGGYGAGAAAAAGCAALAVTGVGAVACGAGVIVAGVVGSEAGKRAAGAAYDGIKAGAGAAVDGVKAVPGLAVKGARKVGDGAVAGAKGVVSGGKKVIEGGGKVISALNPLD